MDQPTTPPTDTPAEGAEKEEEGAEVPAAGEEGGETPAAE